ncbi:MAG: BLUF domain-containing protein [Gammaproteobacteria bacterium]
MRRVIYTSRATATFDERALIDLLHDSRGFNSVDGITGILLHRDGIFFQVLEGETDVIEDVLDRIRHDPRHEQVEVVADDTVTERIFESWSMGFADVSDPALSQLPGVNDAFDDPEALLADTDRLPGLRDRLEHFLDCGKFH